MDFNQRVHNRGLFIVDFGELLPRYDLAADNNSISHVTVQAGKAEGRLELVPRLTKAHHDVQRLVLQPVSSGQGDGVKIRRRFPHEGRLQDVAALPID